MDYRWMLPTRLELAAYFLLGLLTILFSNMHAVEHFLAAGSGFDFRVAAAHSFGSGADRLLGGKIPSTGVIFLFWGMVGLIIYLVLWLSSNFVSEMGADLAARKYLHPEGTDPNFILKAFLVRGFLRTIGVIVLFMYLRFVVQVLLPLWTEAFKGLFHHGTGLSYIRTAAVMFVIEIGALHLIAVFARLALLRKRVFSSYLY